MPPNPSADRVVRMVRPFPGRITHALPQLCDPLPPTFLSGLRRRGRAGVSRRAFPGLDNVDGNNELKLDEEER